MDIKGIIKTLPIGYYLGSNIAVDVDSESECSYFNHMDYKIVISEKQLATVEQNETNIRNMLYHELSHVILTPSDLKRRCWSELTKEVINIFEDERIETVLKDYYLDVDFKEFVKKVNCWDGRSYGEDAKSRFYSCVRFRHCKNKTLLDKVDEIIEKYKDINSNTTNKNSILDCYLDEVWELFREFSKTDTEDSEDKSEDESKSEEGESIETNEETSDSEDKDADPSEDEQTSSSSEDIKKEDAPDGENAESDKETPEIGGDDKAKEEVKKQIKKEISKIMAKKSKEIIESVSIKKVIELALARDRKGNRANTGTGYSGRFNPMNIKPINDTYKWWDRQNDKGDNKRNSKIKINLFCDVSGSFYYSKDQINSIIKTLRQFELRNNKFAFDLVRVGIGAKVADKKDLIVNPNGGNALDITVEQTYKKVQTTGYEIFNIIVFDGNANSDSWIPGCSVEYWKAYNGKNNIIISDPSNSAQIKKYCKDSRVIITYDYVEELEKNVAKMLGALLK